MLLICAVLYFTIKQLLADRIYQFKHSWHLDDALNNTAWVIDFLLLELYLIILVRK